MFQIMLKVILAILCGWFIRCGIADNDTTNKTTSCPGGFIYNSAKNECYECPVGTYSASDRLSCEHCPDPLTTASTASTSRSACKCPASMHVNTSTNLCSDGCSVGAYYEQRNNTCQLCAIGKYQNRESAVTCVDCPSPKTTTLQVGSKSVSDCVCPANTVDHPYRGCIRCPLFSTSPTNISSINGCECHPGFVMEATRQSSVCKPLPCPTNAILQYKFSSLSCQCDINFMINDTQNKTSTSDSGCAPMTSQNQFAIDYTINTRLRISTSIDMLESSVPVYIEPITIYFNNLLPDNTGIYIHFRESKLHAIATFEGQAQAHINSAKSYESRTSITQAIQKIMVDSSALSVVDQVTSVTHAELSCLNNNDCQAGICTLSREYQQSNPTNNAHSRGSCTCPVNAKNCNRYAVEAGVVSKEEYDKYVSFTNDLQEGNASNSSIFWDLKLYIAATLAGIVIVFSCVYCNCCYPTEPKSQLHGLKVPLLACEIDIISSEVRPLDVLTAHDVDNATQAEQQESTHSRTKSKHHHSHHRYISTLHHHPSHKHHHKHHHGSQNALHHKELATNATSVETSTDSTTLTSNNMQGDVPAPPQPQPVVQHNENNVAIDETSRLPPPPPLPQPPSDVEIAGSKGNEIGQLPSPEPPQASSTETIINKEVNIDPNWIEPPPPPPLEEDVASLDDGESDDDFVVPPPPIFPSSKEQKFYSLVKI